MASTKQTPAEKAQAILADLGCEALQSALVKQAVAGAERRLRVQAQTRTLRYTADLEETVAHAGFLSGLTPEQEMSYARAKAVSAGFGTVAKDLATALAGEIRERHGIEAPAPKGLDKAKANAMTEILAATTDPGAIRDRMTTLDSAKDLDAVNAILATLATLGNVAPDKRAPVGKV